MNLFLSFLFHNIGEIGLLGFIVQKYEKLKT